MNDYGDDLFEDAFAEESRWEAAGWRPSRKVHGWWWHPEHGELPAGELRRRLAREDKSSG